MPIQEELARHFVSMTSQTLSTTIAMAHSFFYWVSSSTPVVSEGFQTAATLIGATPSWLVQPFAAAGDNEGQQDSTSTVGQDSVEYYYNNIHALILLLVVLFYFKIVSAVWRSVSAVWKTTVGVFQIVGFVATKMRGLVRCILRGRQDIANGPPALDPSSVPACANVNNVTTNAQSHPAPPPQPPLALPPHGGLWYYYDPVTQTLVPWIPPPLPLPPMFFPPVPAMGGVPPPPPPPARVGRQAQAPLPPPPMPPQEPFFCPIPETEAGRNNDNDTGNSEAVNKNDGRMVNVDYQELAPPPLFGSPRADDKKKNDGVTTHVVATLDKTAAMSNRTILRGTAADYQADPTIGAPSVAATDVAAAANGASAARKRKSPPCDGTESESDDDAKQVDMDEDPLLADLADEDVCHRQHTKKQKLQKARENAKAWADKTFASTNKK